MYVVSILIFICYSLAITLNVIVATLDIITDVIGYQIG